MDVNVEVAKIFGLHSDLPIATTDQTQSCLDRFLHDIPDLPGEGNVSFAWITRRLDMEDFPAHRRIGQPGDDPRLAGLQFGIPDITGRSECFFDKFSTDINALDFAARNPGRPVPHDGGDLAFE